MSKRLNVRPSRLICFGGARALTNAYLFHAAPEDDVVYGYIP